jgi:hypothetical protein
MKKLVKTTFPKPRTKTANYLTCQQVRLAVVICQEWTHLGIVSTVVSQSIYTKLHFKRYKEMKETYGE